MGFKGRKREEYEQKKPFYFYSMFFLINKRF